MAFGGAVKLTGESEYRKALNQITQNLREVTAEMKATSASYDKNDKSQKAVADRTNALNKVLDVQREKLVTLVSQYDKLEKEYNEQTQKHKQLVGTYEKEKAELDRLGKTVGTTSKEYQDQKKKVETLANEVQKSTRAQESNQTAMSKMRVEIANAKGDINTTTKALDDLGKETEDAGKKAEQAGNGGFTVFKGVLANLGSQAITTALNGLKQLGGAFVNIGKQAYNNYAQYEQLVGGVETLFGESSDQLIKYANEAYKTAGVSANEYMEQATSFSATLLQGLGGDTQKAVEYADLAIKDMSDNANKMGTDMSMIQNAYQGFAKDNYTMLDNLKLGYGGTQAEMARLINDSGVLGDSVKVTAETVKDVPFDKIIEGIHVIQQDIGITGTTTAEAMDTIEGSTKTMASAWQNLLTGMASDTADFDGLIKNFVDSVVAVANNMLPRIQTIIVGMGEMISQLLETLVPQIVEMIPPLLEETLPTLLTAVQSMLTAVLDVLPSVIDAIVALIPQVVETILTMIPQLIDAGVQIILGLLDGITQTIPVIVETIPKLIDSIINIFTTNLPLIIDAGLQLIMALVDGIVTALPLLIEKIPEIIMSVVDMIVSELPKILDAGVEILTALLDGIVQAIPKLLEMLPELIIKVVTTLISLLPKIVETGIKLLTSLINGIIQAIPQLIAMLPEIIDTIIQTLMENIGLIIDCGIDLLVGLIDGILGAIPQLIEMLPQIITTIVTTLAKNFPKIIAIGGEILVKLIFGIGKVVGSLILNIGKIIGKMLKKFGELPRDIVDIGKNLVKGLWNGIKDTTAWIIDKIKGFGESVMNGIKKIFGIKSPSRVMRDQVGKNLALGIGEGFEDEMKNVSAQMQDSIPKTFDVDSTINGINGASGEYSAYGNMVNAFKEALSDMKIELDDEVAGRFVDRTVTRLIYT